ncbi:Glucose dehydrogenase [Eumeta japonica]|uniref:Glucose dehydrogenase n=1 Tax=Eumeta variegata TaxID=151549 RepID=A0A4C1TPH7_EUMVA|nr:Glucose dehydrogenase [Eumeta japonica]
MIGGTGAINGMLYIHGTRFDYDRWHKEGLAGWDYDSLLPYFEKSIRPVGNETHPQGYVNLNEFNHFDQDYFDMLFNATEELGISRIQEFDEGSYIGYAHLKGTVANGLRASTGKVHLAHVSGRPNLHVIKNAQATKLLFDDTGRRVKAVEFKLKHQTLRAYTKRK